MGTMRRAAPAPALGWRTFHLPHVRDPRDGVLGATDDERVLGRSVAGRTGLTSGPRPVEERAVGERAAGGRKRAEERVVVGREEEVEIRVASRVARAGSPALAADRRSPIADPDGDVDARFPC